MNKTLVITTIALIAVVMGFSTVAPALQQAFAHDVGSQRGPDGTQNCPANFTLTTVAQAGDHPDHNFNGAVCEQIICHPPPNAECVRPQTVVIDDM